MFDALIHLIVNILNNPAALSLIAGAIVVYMSSCVVKPYKVCKACRRTRESHSKLFKGAFGHCRSCHGRGHHLRFGARLLGRKL